MRLTEKQKQAKVTKEVRELKLQLREEKITKAHLRRLKKAGVIQLLQEIIKLFP